MGCNCANQNGTTNNCTGNMSDLTSLGGCPVAIATGLSAYQIAIANGYSGTEQEWLNSLSGAETGTVPFNVLAGTTQLGLTTSSSYYSVSNNIVTWILSATIAPTTGATGAITLTGFPLAAKAIAGIFPVNIGILTGCSVTASFTMNSGVVSAYKNSSNNVISGNTLTPLEYSDLTAPVSISLSGTYMITGN